MKTNYAKWLIPALIILIGLTWGCDPWLWPPWGSPTPDCEPGMPCVSTPQNILKQGVIIELDNFYTLDDLQGERDSFYVCFNEADSTYFRAEPGVERCRLDTVFYTGKEVFLEALNKVLVGTGLPPKIDEYSNLSYDTCKCAADIFLLQLPSDLQGDPEIENRVASGTSKTREENNGVIRSVGLNHDLGNYMAFYEPQLAPAREKAPDVCGVLVDPTGFEDVDGKKLTRKEKDQIKENMASHNPYGRGDWECDPSPVLEMAKAQADALAYNRVSVAIIDSGMDPFYDYGQTGERPFPMANSYDFTSEMDVLANGVLDLSFGYGEQIPGDKADANGNCLPDDYSGYDYWGDDNNPADRNGHGTHVAGIILSANRTVSHPVRVIPLQFGEQNSQGVFSASLFGAICALNYAVDQQVDIINISWGYSSADTSEVLMSQLERAHAADILTVTSAGNEGQNVDSCQHWPSHFSTFEALHDQLISVAALDTFAKVRDLKLADFSNHGRSVDLAAPGTSISSALIHSLRGTIKLSGTSMAAAVISRRAAMLKQPTATGAPPLSARQLKREILKETVQRIEECVANGRLYRPSADPSLMRAIGYQ